MHDKDIRQILLHELETKFNKHKNTILVQELGLLEGKSRIDIAVINGSLYGYEIKSDSDDLTRLDEQLNTYNKIFDYLTFVVGTKHLDNIKTKLPEWCGLSIAQTTSGQLKIRSIRKPKKNDLIEATALVQLLWREEALNILKNSNLHKGLTQAVRNKIWERLISNFSLDELKQIIRKTLLSRELWKKTSENAEKRIKILHSEQLSCS